MSDLAPHFDAASAFPVLELPEGQLGLSFFSTLIRRGERAYDPLWRYIARVDRARYSGQGNEARVGEYEIGLLNATRVPALIDFDKEVVFLGRKLAIPFPSLEGLVAAHGILPGESGHAFDLLVRAAGCHLYLPLHRFDVPGQVTDLCGFLAKRMRVPLGVASRPLCLAVAPGRTALTHRNGDAPLGEIKALLTARDPGGRVIVRLAMETGKIPLFDGRDPDERIERAGVLLDGLLGIVRGRLRPFER